jgi:hypothetical protein
VVSRIISRVRRLKQLVSEREATRFHPSFYAVQIAQYGPSLSCISGLEHPIAVGAIAAAMILARRKDPQRS